ncbi:MAG: triose-phosphate isomerase [Thermoprotei archaeon]
MYVLAINFKTYKTSYGLRALSIVREADAVAKEYSGLVRVVLLPPATEILRVSNAVSYSSVFAQHVDPVEEGAYTGHVTAEMVKEAGATGIMINHSEKRLRLDEISFILSKARKLGLETLVCADTPEVAAAISILNPHMLAIEPPELIGTGIPVSKAKPEVVTVTVSRVREINKDVTILTGAGITTGDDVTAAIKLGTQGVLVASAVMKAQEPGKVIKEMSESIVKAST